MSKEDLLAAAEKNLSSVEESLPTANIFGRLVRDVFPGVGKSKYISVDGRQVRAFPGIKPKASIALEVCNYGDELVFLLDRDQKEVSAFLADRKLQDESQQFQNLAIMYFRHCNKLFDCAESKQLRNIVELCRLFREGFFSFFLFQ